MNFRSKSHAVGDNAPLISTAACSAKLSTEGVRRASATSQLNISKAPGNPEPPVVASESSLDVKFPIPEVDPEPPIQVVSPL